MKWFYNLKISSKLLTGFILVAFITGLIGYIAITNMKELDDRDTRLYEKMTVPLAQLAKISTAYQRIRVNTREIFLANTKQEINNYLEKIKNYNEEILKQSKLYEKTFINKEDEVDHKLFNEKYLKYFDDVGKFNQMMLENKISEARAIMYGDMFKTAKDVNEILLKMIDNNESAAKETSDENTGIYNSVSKTMIIFIIVTIFVAILIGIFISRIISKPLNRGVSMMQELGKGHLANRLNIETKDEIGILAQTMDQFANDLQTYVIGTMRKISEGDVSMEVPAKDNQDEIAPALNNTIKSIRGLISESGMLTKAAVEGKLSTRGNADKFKGGYKEIVEGVNKTLDAVIGPLNVAAEYVDRISKGDLPKKITDSYNGDFNEIKNNLNNCIDNVNALVVDTNMLTKAAIEGKLSTRADANKHQGDFRKIVEGVNSTLDAVIGPLNVSAEYVDRISKGDIPIKITDNYNGDFNEIKNNLNNCIDNVNAMVIDANMLSKAAIEGKLSTRADAGKHQGDFRKIVEGVNSTLDAVIGPLNVSAKYVDRISKGDIPIKITDNYNGDFNEIKNNLNNCIDNVNAMVIDANMLSKAAVEGKLSTRADAGKHQGDFRKIVDGVNSTLDAVIGPLNVSAEYVDRISKGDIPIKITDNYNGDFNEIKNNLNNCIDNINALVIDANMLSKAAVEGKLSTRADAGKHQGDFRKIVEGVNSTLDAVIGPLNVSAEYVDRISKGDIPIKITDNYNGDFNEIKNNLNNCIDNLNGLIHEMQNMSSQHDAGDIDVQIDTGKFQGVYKTMAVGVNEMVNGHISVKKKAMACIAEFSKGNFNAPLEKFPGKKVFINENIEALRGNLKKIHEQILQLINDSKEGKLSNRGDATKFSGDWTNLVKGINEMLDAVIKPVNEAVLVLQGMAEGDFTKKIEGNYQGDHAILKNGINKTIDSISEILGNVIATVQQVTTGASQVSDASQSLSQGATEQAASLEEISSTMNQVASQTKTNAENASQGEKIAQLARESAQKGNKEMDELTKAMSEITESSKNIAKIIKVIDEIAFQTNLLALNAAVEAARAGRHGKGFAVVAGEVRSLAGRSAKAAKETSDLIEGSIKKVESGGQIAQKTADSLNEIMSNSVKVSDIISEIAAASNEQAQSITQINLGLGQIDKVTQQNTANAEQSASSAEELSGQAIELNSTLTRFKLNGIEDVRTQASFHPTTKGLKNHSSSVAREIISQKKMKMIRPEEVIKLDDDEFGKF